MFRESIELTYSHQDLGRLNEFGLMCLFGNMHSKALTQGVEHSVEDIVDNSGLQLYPAYFYTCLRIPETCTLSHFKAWQPVDLGVEVSRYGKCYLDSKYVVKPAEAGKVQTEDFARGPMPTMVANSLFMVDVTEDASVSRQLAVPKSGTMADLPSVKQKPKAIRKAKKVQQLGTIYPEMEYPLRSKENISYRVIPGRDVAIGHAMIFARFGQVMDCAEHVFLTDHLDLDIGDLQRSEYNLLEREIYYYNNAYSGDVIEIVVKLSFTEVDDPDAAIQLYVDCEYQLFRGSNMELLAIGYVKKGVVGQSWKKLKVHNLVKTKLKIKFNKG